jgi:hypothetical protein
MLAQVGCKNWAAVTATTSEATVLPQAVSLSGQHIAVTPYVQT